MRLGCIQSVTTDKWAQRWHQGHPSIRLVISRFSDEGGARDELLAALRAGSVEAAILRMQPEERAESLCDEPVHAVVLFEEAQAVLLSKDHELAGERGLDVSWLEDFGLTQALLPAPVARDALQSTLVAIPVTNAPTTRVACVWLRDRDAADVQDLVGILRGRTGSSSRAQA